MKRLIQLLLIPAMFFAGSCSKEELDPGSQNGDTQLEENETTTIGSAGGQISTDDFVLEIPRGAFSSDHTMVLSSASERSAFSSDLISTMYSIEGIPGSYDKPLKFKIKYQNDGNGKPHVTLGLPSYVGSLDSITKNYQVIDAADSSGWMTGEIPVIYDQNNASGQKKAGWNDLLDRVDLGVIGFNEHVTGKGHFKILYPVHFASVPDVVALGENLEEAYIYFKDELHFDYSSRTDWEVQVMVYKFIKDPQAYGFNCNSYFGSNYAYLEFNSDYLAQREDIRRTAAHEFFHLVQYLYDARDNFDKVSYPSAHHWFNEATAVWVEKAFTTGDPDFQSEIVKGHTEAPFEGMHRGSGDKPSHHGYGMLSLSNYIVDRWGNEILQEIFQSVFEGEHVVKAIEMHTADPDTWLEDYFRQYLLCNLDVFEVNPQFFIVRAHGKTIIQDRGNFDESFTAVYPDLSAKFFRFGFDDDQITDEDQLILSVDGVHRQETEISLFRYVHDESRMEFMASGTDHLVLKNLQTNFINSSNRLLVLVVNKHKTDQYDDVTSYTLRARMEKELPPPDYNRCGFMVEVLKYYQNTTPESSYDSESDGSISSWESYPGSFTGNVFTGDYTREYPTFSITGSITVELNATHDTVTHVSWSETHQSPDFTQTSVFTGEEIPVNWYNESVFEIEGEETCDHIVSLSSDQTAPEGLNYTLTGYECEWDSKISIRFSKVE